MIRTTHVPAFRIAVAYLTEGVVIHDAVGVVGCDLLAVHRTYRPTPGEAPWSISHVPSGRRIAVAATLEAAIEATACLACLRPSLSDLCDLHRQLPDPERPLRDDQIPSHLAATVRAVRMIRSAAEIAGESAGCLS